MIKEISDRGIEGNALGVPFSVRRNYTAQCPREDIVRGTVYIIEKDVAVNVGFRILYAREYSVRLVSISCG